MIPRVLNLKKLISKKSAFLFGPKSTGKSFWIKKQLTEVHYINLLRSLERMPFQEDPSRLEEVVKAHPGKKIVIDEIQLVPELLHEVHRLIEEYEIIFLLTGSSARKLKKTDANMLGGRAKRADFFPLTWKELSDQNEFNLERFLLSGGIPRIYLSEDYEEELSDYVDNYLNEEIKAEAISRNISGFEKFLKRAAFSSGEILNYSNIASDAQISPVTAKQYFEVLEDTLVGFYLIPWKGPKRKAIQSFKFYLFDIGVSHFLSGINSLPEKSDLFGKAFEHFIIQEVRSLISYKSLRKQLYFWRTTHKDEVDLLIDEDFAIEIKSSQKVVSKNLKGLKKIADEGFPGRRILVSRDPVRRDQEGIELWYWEDFLRYLWGEY